MCTGVFAHVPECVGCVEGLMEPGIYKSRVEQSCGSLFVGVVIAFADNPRLINKSR